MCIRGLNEGGETPDTESQLDLLTPPGHSEAILYGHDLIPQIGLEVSFLWLILEPSVGVSVL